LENPLLNRFCPVVPFRFHVALAFSPLFQIARASSIRRTLPGGEADDYRFREVCCRLHNFHFHRQDKVDEIDHYRRTNLQKDQPAALADGRLVRMPLTKAFWSPRYGMLTDRFGIEWMVMVPDGPPA